MKSDLLLALIAALVLVACEGGHKSVVNEQAEAQVEIGAAQGEVVREKAAGERKVVQAQAQGGLKEIEQAKIDTTAGVAEAEKKVDDEKVEATDEISAAKHAAGEARGSFQRE